MTEPRNGSTAHRGPGAQPLADQPTEVVPLDRYEVAADPPADPAQRTLRLTPPASAPAGPPPPAGHPGPAPGAGPAGHPGPGGQWAPGYGTAPVAVRRADVLAGLLLLLAGMAAGISLLVVWVAGGPIGLELVRDGLQDTRAGAGRVFTTGSWQPLAVVGGGIVLFALGLLLYVPARTHRFLGALALLVSLVAATGVLVPLADAGWDLSRAAVGTWFAVAVGALGLLGALKALSTGPRREPRP
jgi:hypothetical protein